MSKGVMYLGSAMGAETITAKGWFSPSTSADGFDLLADGERQFVVLNASVEELFAIAEAASQHAIEKIKRTGVAANEVEHEQLMAEETAAAGGGQ